MAPLELICFVLSWVAALDIVACNVHVPYSVLMVLTGLGLGLITGLPRISFRRTRRFG